MLLAHLKPKLATGRKSYIVVTYRTTRLTYNVKSQEDAKLYKPNSCSEAGIDFQSMEDVNLPLNYYIYSPAEFKRILQKAGFIVSEKASQSFNATLAVQNFYDAVVLEIDTGIPQDIA